MKNYLHFSIVVVMIALVGCSTHSTTEKGETESSSFSKISDGSATAKIYEQKCSSCHGDTLEGKIGPELTTVGDRLSLQEIETIINDGAPAMPGGLIAEDEAKKVAEWLIK